MKSIYINIEGNNALEVFVGKKLKKNHEMIGMIKMLLFSREFDSYINEKCLKSPINTLLFLSTFLFYTMVLSSTLCYTKDIRRLCHETSYI